MFVSAELSFEIDEYRVLVLPLPVGPVTTADGRFVARQRFGLEPEARHIEHQLVAVQEPHHELLAEQRRQDRDAEVDVFGLAVLLIPDLDASVLGQPLFGDVEPGHDLHARNHRVAELHRRLHHGVEDAVDAVPDPELPLVGLDVDVAGALLDRRKQQHVHELDDRGFLPLARPGRDVERRGPVRVGPPGRVVLRKRRQDRRLGRHHRLHVVAGHELDVVEREDVGGIRHRDGQRRAGTRQRNHLVLLRGVGRQQLQDGRVELELRERNRGHAVLAAEQCRDLILGDESEADQVEPELAAIAALAGQRFLQLLGGDALFLEEEFPDTDGHGPVPYCKGPARSGRGGLRRRP